MPDYGHPLRFATFIAPVNSPAHRPVELAQLSERLGFDFVTFQDHPYQSSFLDTWTLLSWVAARTERIGVSGNVLNLPLRQPPAVLARAAASLDLLSGGRVSLGIGAGYFWDAVQAIGGRRLTPLQAVAALDEAIDVIRGVWDADGPGTPHCRRRVLCGQRRRARTPARTRDPDLARRPQTEDAGLVGRKADGWLPSLPVIGPGACRKETRSSMPPPGLRGATRATSPACSTSSRTSRPRKAGPDGPRGRRQCLHSDQR
jgi:alkanesulfonate monooxygenase SsuD/methylene tetrahydromethanopterin reductase-like flavin-dependent oxidoreductase (luciferase family)